MGAEAVSHADILAAVERIENTIGREYHDPSTGHLTATGLFARIRSVEHKDQQDELMRLRWKNRIWGVTATAGVFAAVLVWFAGDRIDGARDLVRNPPKVEAKK